MLTKTKIALSALLVVGFASAALANETGGYAVGDTWIEQNIQQPAGASAFASATVQRPVKPFTAEEKARFDREAATHGAY
jgi:hypothetical protein